MSDFTFSDKEKEEIRSQFPYLKNGSVYLNHAAISPLSNGVNQALQQFLHERHRGTVENFDQWMERVEDTRSLISDLIGADAPDQITFLGNTSEAISAVAEGFEWDEGDEIILNTLEFPSNIHPFRILENRGVRLIYVEPDEHGIIQPATLEHVITSRTKMLSISAVQYLSGLKADLKAIGEICKKHRIFFAVDGIQALGATNIDVQEFGIDALASGCHKWLMAPMGIGFLYLSEQLQKNLSPYKTGWLSVKNPWQLSNYEQEWLPVSKHLEIGTLNILGILGLYASLQDFNRIGTESIYSEIPALSQYLIDRLSAHSAVTLLTPKTEKYRAGIVTFSIDDGKDPDAFVDTLKKEKNITISARQGWYRISPHYYNTTKELDETLNELLPA